MLEENILNKDLNAIDAVDDTELELEDLNEVKKVEEPKKTKKPKKKTYKRRTADDEELNRVKCEQLQRGRATLNKKLTQYNDLQLKYSQLEEELKLEKSKAAEISNLKTLIAGLTLKQQSAPAPAPAPVKKGIRPFIKF